MQVDLIQLLKTHAIIHPSTVTAVIIGEESVQFRLTGYQWWRADRVSEEADYEFLFSEVSAGHIDPTRVVEASIGDAGSDALEDFFITALAHSDWAKPRICDIFCNAQIKNSVAIYNAVEEHLRQIDSFWPVAEFLNQGHTLSAFLDLTRSSSFLLARCPTVLCDLIVQELGRQGVAHNVLRHGPATANDDRLRVRLDGSDFLCRSAVAILPD